MAFVGNMDGRVLVPGYICWLCMRSGDRSKHGFGCAFGVLVDTYRLATEGISEATCGIFL